MAVPAAGAPPVRTGRTGGVLRIGDVAERTGLSLRTVRHYEEVGLLPPAARTPGGFRLYDDAAVQRLLMIKQLKPLELTLEQVRELLDHVEELATRPAPTRRREVEVRLRSYRALVGQRTDALRQRVLGAESLLDTLDDLLV